VPVGRKEEASRLHFTQPRGPGFSRKITGGEGELREVGAYHTDGPVCRKLGWLHH